MTAVQHSPDVFIVVRKVLASSISSVGRAASMVRKIAAAVVFDVERGRGEEAWSTSRAVDLPQRFSGEVIAGAA